MAGGATQAHRPCVAALAPRLGPSHLGGVCKGQFDDGPQGHHRAHLAGFFDRRVCLRAFGPGAGLVGAAVPVV